MALCSGCASSLAARMRRTGAVAAVYRRGVHILVTGGAGFIGSHVAERLAALGHRVRVLDVRAQRTEADASSWQVPDGVEPVLGDVRDRVTVDRALDGIDAVCHQAAVVGLGVDLDDLPRYAEVNTVGTAVLLAAMARAGVRSLVLASSMVVYGEGTYSCPAPDCREGVVRPAPRAAADLAAGRFEPRCPVCDGGLTPGTVDEAAPLDPRNGYATTKVAQEQLAATWARETGGRGVALRYHNVYGPRMPRDTPYAGVVAIFRSALARGEAPKVFEDGRQRRDFVHVRDVAGANALALEALNDCGAPVGAGSLRTYNIASGRPCSLLEMANVLAARYGGPDPIVTGDFRLGDVRHIVAEPGRAARELAFTAQVSLAAGIGELARPHPP